MIFWRSKRQNQILEEKSIMDEQTKKSISRTIIVAIEKSSRLPLHPPPPSHSQYLGKKKIGGRMGPGDGGRERQQPSLCEGVGSWTRLLRGDNAP